MPLCFFVARSTIREKKEIRASLLTTSAQTFCSAHVFILKPATIRV